MKLLNFKPNPYLRQYISRYWLWENEPDLPQILPGTGTELMFHYYEPFVAKNQKDEVLIAPNCHIISPRSECYHLNRIKHSGFISVRFRAGAFRHFCGESNKELIDSFIDINEIWGKKGQEFGERVIEAKNIEERIVIIEAFLMEFLEMYQQPKSWLDMAVEKVFYGCDAARLKEVRYYDQSHFIKDFKEYVGESPSLFLQDKNFMSHFYNEKLSN